MNASTAITETDLHAYLDGELPVTRLADVEAYLATSPQEALRLRDYQAQGRALREMFNTILEEPLPDALRQRAMQPAPSVQATQTLQPLPRWSLQRIAAGFLLAVVSGAAGWLGHGQYQANDRLAALLPLPHHAAVAHTVFKRMGGPMRPPKLGPLGYELVGGRLLPGDNGPVAQFMYQDANGQRLTLYVSTEIKTNQDTAFRYTQEGQVNVFYWVDGKWGYAISASVPKSALSLVATSVYDQLERKP
jgi:anti-sigma factor RsiW